MIYNENLKRHHAEIVSNFSEAKTVKEALTPKQVNELFSTTVYSCRRCKVDSNK